MTEFKIPDRALQKLQHPPVEEGHADDCMIFLPNGLCTCHDPQPEAEAAVVEEWTPPAPIIGGYAGFVCAECRRPVDHYIRGDHAPGCSLAVHNESLMEGAEQYAQFIQAPSETTGTRGIYHGKAPTSTERESGESVEVENFGPLKPGGAGHRALLAFDSGRRLTAYDASVLATGDFHAIRREATRLLVRGFLVKDGTLPNKAPRGRARVDAYRITLAGIDELERLA